MPEALALNRPASSRWLSLAAPLLHLQILLVLAIVFGGGGVAYGTRNLLITLFALLLLAIHGGLVARFVREAPLGLRLLLLATLCLPLLQLVPLPPTMWQALPGRETVLASHRVAGFGDGLWFPLSVDRARTLVAFTGLIAPVTIVLLGSMLPSRDKILLGWTLLIGTIAAMAWGVVQLQTGNTFGLLYPINARPEVLYATFANRNSNGLLLVIGMVLAVALARAEKPASLIGCAVVAVLLAVGVIITKSRSSIVLMSVPLLLVLLRLAMAAFASRMPRSRATTTAGAVVAGVALIAAAALAISAFQGGRVADSLSRFGDAGADRPEMWEDGIYAAEQYWPVGSGAGTFDEVFQLHESLEFISPRRAGRAHSDFVELGMEAGLFGLALAALWLAWTAAATWTNLRRGPNWPGVGAGLAVGAIALQSLLDYPLRNQTLLCVAGVLVVLLAIRRERSAAAP